MVGWNTASKATISVLHAGTPAYLTLYLYASCLLWPPGWRSFLSHLIARLAARLLACLATYLDASLVSCLGRFLNNLCGSLMASCLLSLQHPTYLPHLLLFAFTANDCLTISITSTLATSGNWLGCMFSCGVLGIGSSLNTVIARRLLALVCLPFVSWPVRSGCVRGGRWFRHPSLCCLFHG